MKNQNKKTISVLNLLKTYLNQSNLLLGICLLLVMLIMYFFRLDCPILHMTGVSCPGCGMIRAYFALLHLNIKKAAFFHPLWWLPPFVPLVWLLYQKKKISYRTYQNFFLFLTGMFLCAYLIRILFFRSYVVRFSPENGVFFQTIQKIFHMVTDSFVSIE